jgi:hypothetical protein
LAKRTLQFCERDLNKTYSKYFQALYKYKQAITITWRTPRSKFIKNLLKNSNSKTRHSGFLGTKALESSDRVPDEFVTNLKLLKIAYKVHHRELNRDTIIYSCNLED